jgi:hypothetical protein
LGEWQKNQLAGLDAYYIIALSSSFNMNTSPTPATIAGLQMYIDVHVDAWLFDIGGTNSGVASRYCPYVPMGDCSVSMTIVIDREMTIRYLGSTHVTDATEALELLVELASE